MTPPRTDGSIRWRYARTTSGRWPARSSTSTATVAGSPGHGFCPTVTDLTKTCTKLHSKGFRNPFRFQLRPADAGLLVGDVGWGTWEEVDLITQPGRSWGWPCYEGSSRTPGYSGYSECSAQYALEGGPQANLPPAFQYSHSDEPRPGYGAILPGPVYQGTAYPSSYRGTALFGDYAKGVLRRLEFDGDTVVGATDFGTGWYGVDLEASPQGNIVSVFFGDGSPGTGYVAELVYTAGNRAPVAAAGPDRSGVAPLQVSFDGSASSDPDGDALTHSWDPGDGSAALPGAQVAHTYTAPGTYTATLTVDDGRGMTATDTARIDVGNTAPVPSIAAPADGSTFRIGTDVTLQGSATDAQDGPLPASALTWQVNLIHGAHLHPVTTITGQAQASFSPLADHDADSFYRVTLTARDSGGVTASVTHTVVPQTVAVTLASSPTGAPVTFGPTAGVAPLLRTSAVGHQTTITAADTFVASGRRQVFTGWSDGGGRSHDITVPAVDTQLTATYRDDGPVLPPGLQAAYGFENGSGTTATDITGNGHDATLTGGPAWVPEGRYGKALSFDGLDDLGTIASPAGIGLSGPHTISAWVRPRTLRNWQTVLMNETPGSYANALYATNGSSQGKINGWVGDTGLYAQPIATDRWTHLALTYDGTSAREYVDGSLVATKLSPAAPTGTGPLRLGGNRVWSSETLDGLLDDVRLYNRALTAADIATDMATGLVGVGDPPAAATAPAAPTHGWPGGVLRLRGSVRGDGDRRHRARARRDDLRRRPHDGGAQREGADVRRVGRPRHRGRSPRPRPHQRHDPGGMGSSRHDQDLADHPREGGRLRPGLRRVRDRRRHGQDQRVDRRARCVLAHTDPGRSLDPRCRDARRRSAAPVPRRRAGLRDHRRERGTCQHRSAADRRQLGLVR